MNIKKMCYNQVRYYNIRNILGDIIGLKDINNNVYDAFRKSCSIG